MTAKRVLIITPEPLPLAGQPTTGAGLRAWGLAQGLHACGFDTIVASWAATFAECYLSGETPLPERVRMFQRDRLGAFIEEVEPEVVVLQHWGMASEVPPLEIPLAVDLAGPHLMERLFWGETDFARHAQEKLEALRRADFLVCSGKYQRHYFYGWLTLAGYAPWEIELPVIPFSVPPSPSPRVLERDTTAFVYGGTFLAWQDPSAALRIVAEELERSGKGSLHLHVGTHPVLDASGGAFATLADNLLQQPRVTRYPLLPFDELVRHYVRYGVALDLMAWNCERELAFTTRTMIYLWCGLPVIHDNYSELGDLIREAGCGWAVDPCDEAGLREIIHQILEGRVDVAQMGEAARAFAERYSWDRTIEPLVQFCAAPEIRRTKPQRRMVWETQTRELAELRAECTSLRTELDALRSHWILRAAQGLSRLMRRFAPVLRVLLWPVARWLRWRLQKTAKPRCG